MGTASPRRAHIMTTPPAFNFQPGAAVGILGGGQLGRLLATEAHKLGLRTHVLCYKPTDPAALIATSVTIIDTDWKDTDALLKFANSGIRWVLCEWENVPVSAVEFIGKFVQVHSTPEVLGFGRSRKAEKSKANELGIKTVPWMDAIDCIGRSAATDEWSKKDGPFILKSDNGGYDGGGQKEFSDWGTRSQHYRPGHKPAIIEQRVALAKEFSIIVARDMEGNIEMSPALRNKHTDHYGGGILATTTWYPGCIEPEFELVGQQAARKIAEHLGQVGTSCAEFFITKADEVLFNEWAPMRPHNSGHGTIEAAARGQNQFYWALASVIPGLHLQPMEFKRPWRMYNLIGADVDFIPRLHRLGLSTHHYGKSDPRWGRKTGHATHVAEDEKELYEAFEIVTDMGLETPFVWQ